LSLGTLSNFGDGLLVAYTTRPTGRGITVATELSCAWVKQVGSSVNLARKLVFDIFFGNVEIGV